MDTFQSGVWVFLVHSVSQRVVYAATEVEAYDVFISYSWSTRDMVRQIRDRLKEKGYKIWFDEDNVGVYE